MPSLLCSLRSSFRGAGSRRYRPSSPASMVPRILSSLFLALCPSASSCDIPPPLSCTLVLVFVFSRSKAQPHHPPVDGRSSTLAAESSLHTVCTEYTPAFSAACRCSLPLALHLLDVIRQIRCAYRNTRSTMIYYHCCFVSRSPMLLSLLRCGIFTHMRAKQSPNPPRRYISPKSDKGFRTAPSFLNEPKNLTKSSVADRTGAFTRGCGYEGFYGNLL